MEERNGVSITDKVVVYQKKISVLKNFRILDCQLNEKTGKDAIFIFKELWQVNRNVLSRPFVK